MSNYVENCSELGRTGVLKLSLQFMHRIRAFSLHRILICLQITVSVQCHKGLRG
jgi:hypothetical protein